MSEQQKRYRHPRDLYPLEVTTRQQTRRGSAWQALDDAIDAALFQLPHELRQRVWRARDEYARVRRG